MPGGPVSAGLCRQLNCCGRTTFEVGPVSYSTTYIVNWFLGGSLALVMAHFSDATGRIWKDPRCCTILLRFLTANGLMTY